MIILPYVYEGYKIKRIVKDIEDHPNKKYRKIFFGVTVVSFRCTQHIKQRGDKDKTECAQNPFFIIWFSAL